MKSCAIIVKHPIKTPRLYPPLWFLLFAISALAVSIFLPLHVELGLTGRVLSMLSIVSGAVVAGWARGIFHFTDTSAHPFNQGDRLITHGIYRISRNPMYLGMLLVLIGLVIWLENPGGLLLPPLFVLVINRRHIEGEERRLTEQFGETYLAYQNQTRRWI